MSLYGTHLNVGQKVEGLNSHQPKGESSMKAYSVYCEVWRKAELSGGRSYFEGSYVVGCFASSAKEAVEKSKENFKIPLVKKLGNELRYRAQEVSFR